MYLDFYGKKFKKLKLEMSCIFGIFDPTVTLTLDLLTPKFDAFILPPKSISGESLVKFHQQISKILGRTHHASGHCIGKGRKIQTPIKYSHGLHYT